MRFKSYVERTLLSVVHVAYYVLMLSFYTTCYESLVLDRSSLVDDVALNSKNDTYYVLLALNCFKPIAWFVIIYYDTRYYYTNVDAIVSGAVLLCVFLATMALEIAMGFEYSAYCNYRNVHYNNPCNDVLYCCYYPENPTCERVWGVGQNTNATLIASRCVYGELPDGVKSRVRWLSTVDANALTNASALNAGTFALSADVEFKTCFIVTTIVMLFEFVFFTINMYRISDKIREFIEDNDEEFEQLDESSYFGVPASFTKITRYFTEDPKDGTIGDDDVVAPNDEPFYGVKTTGAGINDRDDDYVTLDLDRQHAHAQLPSSKRNACKRCFSLCFAKCYHRAFNFKSKIKTAIFSAVYAVRIVCVTVKNGLTGLFIMKTQSQTRGANKRRKKNKEASSSQLLEKRDRIRAGRRHAVVNNATKNNANETVIRPTKAKKSTNVRANVQRAMYYDHGDDYQTFQ